ncbi:MAG TPA: fatty acid desaturase family protein [Acidimicrobiales bacterium]|nr:fatty acid desaturase family protein [Acidimicrobiales bacterium]
MVATLVPRSPVLPDVLPTERLSAAGRPVPAVRERLRRIPDGRNVLTVLGAWIQSFGVVAAAVWIDRWWSYAVAFFLVGRGFALLNILGHEAAHRLLFSRRKLNDVVGRWMLAYPAFTPLDLYRRVHMAHHREEFGDDEPDMGLYSGYPITVASMRRKLVRDAIGISGWKNLKPLLKALGGANSRPIASRIVGVQVVLWAAFWLASGRWWLYPLLWLAPWMSVWRVINRLRAIAEHGGMERSTDRRKTTHVVRQRPLARFWMVPYNTGWHLAHHVDIGIPWRNLPALHDELVAAGWISPELEYPSYTALWRALASG